MSAAEGQIVTFYSYKGGTGRSMMLANVAWILACNGKRVLTIDWDLEAPGLHRYFQPFLFDENLLGSEGVIDFVSDYTTAARRVQGKEQEDDWFDPYADLAQYAVPLDWDFNGGRLDHVGAGRQGASYSMRVSSFDWVEFYDDFGGGAFLSRTREHLKRGYDYVLIDSRTGLADTSGICTVQMPDALVVCFTLNNQSVNGAAEVAESVRRQRGEDLRILSVPMRVDNSEKIKLDLRREAALKRFTASTDTPAGLERQWAEVEVGYQPFYAYEEVLATFGDVPGRGHTILAAAERIAAWVTGNEVTEAGRVSESRRREVLARYEGTLVSPPLSALGSSVYISYRRGDAGYSGRLYDELVRQLGTGRVAMDVELEPGVDFVEHVERAIGAAAVVLVVIGPGWLERQRVLGADPTAQAHDIVALEIDAALAAEKRVVPVFVGGVSPRQVVQFEGKLAPLARRQAIELSDSRWDHDLRRLTAAVELAIAGAGQSSSAFDSTSPAQYRTSSESRDVIDVVLGRQRWVTWLLAVSISVTAASLLALILTLVKP